MIITTLKTNQCIIVLVMIENEYLLLTRESEVTNMFSKYSYKKNKKYRKLKRIR